MKNCRTHCGNCTPAAYEAHLKGTTTGASFKLSMASWLPCLCHNDSLRMNRSLMASFKYIKSHQTLLVAPCTTGWYLILTLPRCIYWVLSIYWVDAAIGGCAKKEPCTGPTSIKMDCSPPASPKKEDDSLRSWPREDRRRILHAVYRVGDIEKSMKWVTP